WMNSRFIRKKANDRWEDINGAGRPRIIVEVEARACPLRQLQDDASIATAQAACHAPASVGVTTVTDLLFGYGRAVSVAARAWLQQTNLWRERTNNGNIVVYETRAEAEAAAAKLAAANKNPNISFTVTEFEPTD